MANCGYRGSNECRALLVPEPQYHCTKKVKRGERDQAWDVATLGCKGQLCDGTLAHGLGSYMTLVLIGRYCRSYARINARVGNPSETPSMNLLRLDDLWLNDHLAVSLL